MARRHDETLGWGTIGFWCAVAGVFLAVLAFGVFVPSSTQVSNVPVTEQPAERQQPVEQRRPTTDSTR